MNLEIFDINLMFFYTDTKIFGNLQIKQNFISIYKCQFIIMLVNAHFQCTHDSYSLKVFICKFLVQDFFSLFMIYQLLVNVDQTTQFHQFEWEICEFVSFSMKLSIWILLCWSIVNFPQLFTSVKQGNSADLTFKVKF